MHWAAHEIFSDNMPYLYFGVLLKLMESREKYVSRKTMRQHAISRAKAWKQCMNSMVEQAIGLKASLPPTQFELFSDCIILKIKIQAMSENAYLRYRVLYRQKMLNSQQKLLLEMQEWAHRNALNSVKKIKLFYRRILSSWRHYYK